MKMVNKSSEKVRMRGTMTPLLDTLCISNPNRSFGEIDALTDSSATPTLVSGVVVIRRRDFGIAGMEHISRDDDIE
jgi:hypothetical protein